MCVHVCILTGDPQQDFVRNSHPLIIGGETLVLSLVVLWSSSTAETDFQCPGALPHRHPGIFPDVEKLAVPSPFESEPQDKSSKKILALTVVIENVYEAPLLFLSNLSNFTFHVKRKDAIKNVIIIEFK